MLEFVEERHEVAEVASEAVQGSNGDQVELPPACVGQELIETRTLLARATDRVIGELSDDRPAGALGMFVERTELVLSVHLAAGVSGWPGITVRIQSEWVSGFRRNRCPVSSGTRTERTFWEKATIFHAENHREFKKGATPKQWTRISRHAYDLVMLDQGGVADRALGALDLLGAVVRHKDCFYHSGWARYLEAQPGTFRLAPNEELEAALRQDYAAMDSMFLGPHPTFETIVDGLRDLESRINRLANTESGA